MAESTAQTAALSESEVNNGAGISSFIERHPALVGIALTLFGLFFALVCIEIGFRVLYRGGADTWDDRPTTFFLPEGAETLQAFTHAATKPANTLRIAVVGDSFAFAPYMQYDDAFPKRLERWLNLNQHQQRVEVVNYGVPRYSTSHEINVVKRALDQQADLVLLQITLNDPEIKPYTPTSLLLDSKTGEVKFEGWLFRHWKSLTYVLTRIENSQTHQDYVKYFFRLFERKDTWGQFSNSLKSIAALCEERHVPLVAAVFPLFGYPVNEQYPFFPLHEKVKTQLESLKVPSLDLADIYRNIPLERLQVIPVKDRHPNEIAHRMAAEALLKWLRERDVLPADIFPRFVNPTRIGIYPQGAAAEAAAQP